MPSKGLEDLHLLSFYSIWWDSRILLVAHYILFMAHERLTVALRHLTCHHGPWRIFIFYLFILFDDTVGPYWWHIISYLWHISHWQYPCDALSAIMGHGGSLSFYPIDGLIGPCWWRNNIYGTLSVNSVLSTLYVPSPALENLHPFILFDGIIVSYWSNTRSWQYPSVVLCAINGFGGSLPLIYIVHVIRLQFHNIQCLCPWLDTTTCSFTTKLKNVASFSSRAIKISWRNFFHQ